MGDEIIALDDPTSATNLPIKNFLLKRGVTWADEFNNLRASVTDNGTIPVANVTDTKYNDTVGIWSMRISLKIMRQYYLVCLYAKKRVRTVVTDPWASRPSWGRMPRLIPVSKDGFKIIIKTIQLPSWFGVYFCSIQTSY
jgi:hypothetical protein